MAQLYSSSLIFDMSLSMVSMPAGMKHGDLRQASLHAGRYAFHRAVDESSIGPGGIGQLDLSVIISVQFPEKEISKAQSEICCPMRLL
jgi:hypothetical protein